MATEKGGTADNKATTDDHHRAKDEPIVDEAQKSLKLLDKMLLFIIIGGVASVLVFSGILRGADKLANFSFSLSSWFEESEEEPDTGTSRKDFTATVERPIRVKTTRTQCNIEFEVKQGCIRVENLAGVSDTKCPGEDIDLGNTRANQVLTVTPVGATRVGFYTVTTCAPPRF